MSKPFSKIPKISAKSKRAQITRVINRFEKAVKNKAFEGTIPWDTDEAIDVHYYIEKEYTRARYLLERLICQNA